MTAENAYWKCPKCDLGFTFEQHQKFQVLSLAAVRNRHEAKAHPRAGRKGFPFRQSASSVAGRARAAVATRNRAAVRRIISSKESPHQVTFFKWPKWWQRASRQDVLCLKCKRIAKSVGLLNRCPCKI